MVISDCTVGMGITGSFCSFEKTKDVAKRLVEFRRMVWARLYQLEILL